MISIFVKSCNKWPQHLAVSLDCNWFIKITVNWKSTRRETNFFFRKKVCLSEMLT